MTYGSIVYDGICWVMRDGEEKSVFDVCRDVMNPMGLKIRVMEL